MTEQKTQEQPKPLTIEQIKEQSVQQRQLAKNIGQQMYRQEHGLPDNVSNTAIDLLVDAVINTAVLEVMAISRAQQPAPAKPVDTPEEV